MTETIFTYLIISLEYIGVAIIVIGTLKMLLVFGTCLIKRIPVQNLMTQIRIDLSNYLVLSLEVFIGRDIIETLLHPTFDDLISLIVLVVLRTVLAFFINYEMSHFVQKHLPSVFDKKEKAAIKSK